MIWTKRLVLESLLKDSWGQDNGEMSGASGEVLGGITESGLPTNILKRIHGISSQISRGTPLVQTERCLHQGETQRKKK